jgi:hypothetical protein
MPWSWARCRRRARRGRRERAQPSEVVWRAGAAVGAVRGAQTASGTAGVIARAVRALPTYRRATVACGAVHWGPILRTNGTASDVGQTSGGIRKFNCRRPATDPGTPPT